MLPCWHEHTDQHAELLLDLLLCKAVGNDFRFPPRHDQTCMSQLCFVVDRAIHAQEEPSTSWKHVHGGASANYVTGPINAGSPLLGLC